MREIGQKGAAATNDDTLLDDPEEAQLVATQEALQEVGNTVNELVRTNSLSKNNREQVDELAEEERTIAASKQENSLRRQKTKRQQAKDRESGTAKNLTVENVQKEVSAIFDKLDANKDGKLSPEEAKTMILEWKEKNMRNSEGTEIIFNDVDTNQDGFISKEELIRFITDLRVLDSEAF